MTPLVVPYLFAVLRKGNNGKQGHGVFEEVPRMNDLEQLPSLKGPPHT